MKRLPYPSDVTDDEWQLIKPLIPISKGLGHPRTVNIREIVNAIFYWADNGIKWRGMPHDLPPWSTVYDYFRRWVKTGVWERINTYVIKIVRKSEGRHEQPSLMAMDSQSVKTLEKKGLEQGVDGFKRIKGRKRHVIVDTLGLVHNCFVSAANLADVKAVSTLLEPLLTDLSRVKKVLADQGYQGTIKDVINQVYGCVIEITKKLGEGFVVAPWRWVVERTFSWLDKSRRLARDYEELPENHEAVVYIVMIRIMLRRLTDNQRQRLNQST